MHYWQLCTQDGSKRWGEVSRYASVFALFEDLRKDFASIKCVTRLPKGTVYQLKRDDTSGAVHILVFKGDK